MLSKEFINEGGWTDTITQQTKLTPDVVKSALQVTQDFTNQFNKYLQYVDLPPVQMGHPTGSSAYHDVDEPTKEYGDIDLQMIAQEMPGKTPNQVAALYNKHVDNFISTKNPPNVYDTGKASNGHVIFALPDGGHVQVDLLWTTENISDWSRWRVTPERGVKGLIYGNMYSSLGEIMNMSIQTAGVQMKTVNGEPVPYSKRKGTELHTLSHDIENFGIDILRAVYEAVNGDIKGLQIDEELTQYPGLNKAEVKITDLAHTIRGLAKSFEMNDLYGKYNLTAYNNAQEFMEAFITQFTKKAMEAANAPKFKKASTPAELKQVKHVQDQIHKGLKIVHNAFKYT